VDSGCLVNQNQYCYFLKEISIPKLKSIGVAPSQEAGGIYGKLSSNASIATLPNITRVDFPELEDVTYGYNQYLYLVDSMVLKSIGTDEVGTVILPKLKYQF